MQSSELPSETDLDKWMTSLSNWNRWGEDDQLGTLNHITPERRAAAARLVTDGVTIGCSRLISYETAADVPHAADHYMTSSGDAYRPGEGPNLQMAADYFGLIFHGNGVTHLDSLSHFFWDGRMYNGFPSTLVSNSEGAKSLSIDVVRDAIVGRALLVDVPRLRGIDVVPRKESVRLSDIEAAERECGFEVGPGDILMIRTGQIGHRKVTGPLNPLLTGSAGPDPELLPFFHERRISVIACDGPNEVYPSRYEKYTAPIHQIGIVAMGLWLLDHVDMEELSRACASRNRWEFMMTVSPLRIFNGTGSPVNPIAVF
ncbi:MULTISPECIES: cyclase family protein [unclassified Arthrobacter]|uniref:cyclase family protein n=1 Tax=unclassified Arthrobacter TaxID=235627 RepID=UPI001C84B370|nr:cyclase family protein [Arthrobacter sp. MAHUQ-56]MBX7444630.1 cyclase family protein [Arthrobacter sp. MAHUQ-56]